MGTGGAESVVCDLAADTAGRGDDVALVAAPGPLDARLASLSLTRVPLAAPGAEPARTARAALAMRRALRDFRPDVIHAHNPRVTAAARLGRRLAGMGRTPILSTFHAGPPERDRSVARVLSGVERVACVSEPLRDKLVAEGLDPGRVVVVRNGVAAARELSPEARDALRAELGLGDGPTIAAVGRLAPEKAHSRYPGGGRACRGRAAGRALPARRRRAPAGRAGAPGRRARLGRADGADGLPPGRPRPDRDLGLARAALGPRGPARGRARGPRRGGAAVVDRASRRGGAGPGRGRHGCRARGGSARRGAGGIGAPTPPAGRR